MYIGDDIRYTHGVTMEHLNRKLYVTYRMVCSTYNFRRSWVTFKVISATEIHSGSSNLEDNNMPRPQS